MLSKSEIDKAGNAIAGMPNAGSVLDFSDPKKFDPDAFGKLAVTALRKMGISKDQISTITDPETHALMLAAFSAYDAKAFPDQSSPTGQGAGVAQSSLDNQMNRAYSENRKIALNQHARDKKLGVGKSSY